MFRKIHARHRRSTPTACLRLGLAVWVLVLTATPGPAHAEEAAGAGGDDPLARHDAGVEESRDPDPNARDEPANAEEARGYATPSPRIEEIVITGTETSGLIDTAAPTSAIGFDAAELAALGVADVEDIAMVTPNLEINTSSGTTPTFFIRGVGLNDFGANATGAVAIYKDGAPINAPALQLGLLFDSQVAVLRGPQGTGNWRNSSAGAITFTPNLPTGDLEGGVRADMGNYGLVDVEGFLSSPVSDELSSRVAFRYRARDPYINNQCGGLSVPTRGACGANPGTNFRPLYVPPGLADELDDEGEWALRTLLRLEPADSEMDWWLNLHGGQVDHQAPLGQVIGTRQSAQGPLTRSGYIDPAIAEIHAANRERYPGDNIAANFATLKTVTDDIGRADPLDNAYNLTGDERLTTYGATINGTVLFDDVELHVVTNGERWDRQRHDDLDFSPDTVVHRHADDDGWQITQSAELSSALDWLPLRWRAGGFYLYDELGSDTLFNFSLNPLFAQNVDQEYSQYLHSFGVYAGLDVDLTDYLRLEGGVRYNWQTTYFQLQVARSLTGRSNNSSLPADDQRTWDAPTGGVSLTYTPVDEVSMYLKYTRGWKPGQFNAAILENVGLPGQEQVFPEITTAKPETIDAFEMGFESRLFDDLAEVRAAAFYYMYDNYQVFVLQTILGSPPQFEIINAKDSIVYGAEIDIHAEPLRNVLPEEWGNLFLDFHWGWLESEFKNFVRRRDTIVGGALITDYIDYSGNRLPNTPSFKLSGAVSYELPLGSFGTIVPRYDFSFTDDNFFDPSEGRGDPPAGTRVPLPDYAIGQRAYWLHNLWLGYRLPGDWIEIAGWVRNLTDERYKTFVADGTIAIESLLNYIGDPRTFGGSVSISF